MPSLLTQEAVVVRACNGFSKTVPIYGSSPGGTQSLLVAAGAASNWRRGGFVKGPPSVLETGVSEYLVTNVDAFCTLGAQPILIAEVFNMGTLDIGANTFVDGVAAPTVKEAGVTRQVPLMLFAEVSNAAGLTGSSNQITFTYVNQDGTGGRIPVTQTLTNTSPRYSIGVPVLQSPDTGVLDITAASRPAGTTPGGTIDFLGIRPIYHVGAVSGFSHAPLNEGVPYRLAAGANVGVFLGTTTAAGVLGAITYVGAP